MVKKPAKIRSSPPRRKKPDTLEDLENFKDYPFEPGISDLQLKAVGIKPKKRRRK